MDDNLDVQQSSCTVAIVGGGPSGLALATELKRLGVAHVVVLEREAMAGGVSRHCGHYPFALREYKRVLKGPDYAQRNVDCAIACGVDIRTHSTVSALHSAGVIDVASPELNYRLKASRVVLCTGVRESTRAQRLISGDRPLGVMSTGALQSLVYLQGMRPFNNPVIVGSELVSFSAISTCRHLGIKPLAMLETQPRILAQRVVQPYLNLNGMPLHAGISSLKIIGQKQVEAVEFVSSNNTPVRIACDGVIVSGRFRPEAALVYQSHLELDAGSGGPVVDQFGQCSDPAFYCAGNLLRPAESAGWCWQEGIHTARRIAHELSIQAAHVQSHIGLYAADPSIRFILPQRLSLSTRTGGMSHMQIGLNTAVNGYLEARSEGKCIWRERLNARPVRRIQKSLSGILNAHPQGDVALSINRSDRRSFQQA